MATRIRLARRGRKKAPQYDVVVADSRAPRDGKFIEKIGTYNPVKVPAEIKIDADKALKWLMTGAQPSDTVERMLRYKGLMYRKHLQVGVNKGAITQEVADERFAKWQEEKNAKLQKELEKIAQDKNATKKERLAAEAKVNEARAEAIRKKRAEEKAAEEAAAAEANAEAAAENAEGTENAAEGEAPAAEASEEKAAE